MHIPSNASFARGNEARRTGNVPFPPRHVASRRGNAPRDPLPRPLRPLRNFEVTLDSMLRLPLSYAHRRRLARGLPREALSGRRSRRGGLLIAGLRRRKRRRGRGAGFPAGSAGSLTTDVPEGTVAGPFPWAFLT